MSNENIPSELVSNEKWSAEQIFNKYYLGDCMDILPHIPDKTFDLIILDPPYFIPAKHYQTRKDFKRSFGDLGILEFFFKRLFFHIERTLKDKGFFYIFCNEDSYFLFYYYSFFFTKKVRLIIWDKILSINGYHWRHQYELILFGILPQSPKVVTGDGDIIKQALNFNDIDSLREYLFTNEEKRMLDDLISHRAVEVNKRTHPAEKPAEIIEKLILKSSKKKDLIADFFCGSAVTLKTAKKLQRNYFGIEYDKYYYDMSLKELESIPLTNPSIPKVNKKIDSFFL